LRGRRNFAAVAAATLLLLTACSSNSPPSSGSTGSTHLTVLAAASLTKVFPKIGAEFVKQHPGTSFGWSFAGTDTLAAQIEQGAPADVFLSADQTNPKKLVDKTLADAPVTFAGNRLTVIVPTDNPGKVVAATDVGRPGVKVIAAGDKVPITRYATQLVANLSKGVDDPAAFVAAYAKNIVSKEDNVAAVVSKIELGEGDAAIVYVTDAKASTKVGTVEIIPASANVLATYAGVVVKSTTQPDAANAFLAWLAGPDGQAILGEFGFLPPS
jgi:molybdate transport system substrate-binding protein